MRKSIFCGLALLGLGALAARAMVITGDGGKWPADWPKELESLRGHARTIDVAAANQEHIYEITFTDRAAFESAWPAIVSVKSPGAPLTLTAVKSPSSAIISNAAPAVRIYAPCANSGEIKAADGAVLKPCAPWPKDVVGPDGHLPEYVYQMKKDGHTKWAPADPKNWEAYGFMYRARVDVELVIDGQVIDLNRVKLPPDTPVNDRRFGK